MNVLSKDISNNQILKRPQALPRFDCNFFPYGQVSGIIND